MENMVRVLRQADGCFHTRIDILNTHEAADSKLAHQRLDFIFYAVNIVSTFIIFAYHTLTDIIRIMNAECHGIDNFRNILHIFY